MEEGVIKPPNSAPKSHRDFVRNVQHLGMSNAPFI